MRSRLRSTLAIAALAVVAGACGSDSSTSPDSGVRADLRQAFGDLSHPALSDALGSLSGLFVSPGPTSGCNYAAASQTFVCPTQSEAGLTLAFSYGLLDASGAAQSAFGATTTNAVHAIYVLSGTTTELGPPLTLDGRQDLTVSGLLSAKHTLNGSSSFRLTGSIETGGRPIPIAVTTKTTITNLVLPSGTIGASAWPASGTILIEDIADGAAGPDRVLVTFDGTSTISTVFTTSTGHETRCTMDLLRQGEVTCPT